MLSFDLEIFILFAYFFEIVLVKTFFCSEALSLLQQTGCTKKCKPFAAQIVTDRFKLITSKARYIESSVLVELYFRCYAKQENTF